MKNGPVEISVSIKVNSTADYSADVLAQVRQEVTVPGNIGENKDDVLAQLAETANACRERVALELEAQATLARIQAENAGD